MSAKHTHQYRIFSGSRVFTRSISPFALFFLPRKATGPLHGTLTSPLAEDGTFAYLPSDGWSGTDTFVYTLTDSNGDFDTATVTIEVVGVNEPPVAVNDSFSTNEDTPFGGDVVNGDLSGGPATRDSDPEGDRLIVSVFTEPQHGTLTMNEFGVFTYTPDSNYNGPDSFVYEVTDGQYTDQATVTIQVNEVNDGPLPEADSYQTNEDTPLTTGNVLENDSDPDGNPLLVNTVPVSPPTNGVLQELNSDGSFTYIPNEDFVGTDSFQYMVSDGQGGTGTATVTIEVLPVNDAPEATDDTAVTNEDEPVSGNVLTNDSDPEGDPLTASLLGEPKNGDVTVSPNGDYTYTPNPDFNGSDSFTYEVSDDNGGTDIGSVFITVNPVNDAPVGVDDSYAVPEDTTLGGNVLDNDTDIDGDDLSASLVSGPSHGTLTLNPDGTFTYVPDENFNGSDSFVYEVSDTDGLTDTATVTISVNEVNDGPVVANDVAETDQDVPVSGNVLLNDSDVDGDTLTVSTTPASPPANGVVTLSPNGDYTYTPNPGFDGVDTFDYSVSDGSGSTTATVTVTVNPVPETLVSCPTVTDMSINAETIGVKYPGANVVPGNPEGIIFMAGHGEAFTQPKPPIEIVSGGPNSVVVKGRQAWLNKGLSWVCFEWMDKDGNWVAHKIEGMSGVPGSEDEYIFEAFCPYSDPTEVTLRVYGHDGTYKKFDACLSWRILSFLLI